MFYVVSDRYSTEHIGRELYADYYDSFIELESKIDFSEFLILKIMMKK